MKFSNICGCTWCVMWKDIVLKCIHKMQGHEVLQYMESGITALSLTIYVVWDYCMYVFSCDCTMYHMFSTCYRKVLYQKIDYSISTYNCTTYTVCSRYGCAHYVYYIYPDCTAHYFFKKGLSGLIISDIWSLGEHMSTWIWYYDNTTPSLFLK